jgi:hypothetical protein
MRTTATILLLTILTSCSDTTATKQQDQIPLADTTTMEQSIFFHEDDYCQVQLTVKENLTHLQKEAEEVLGFAKEHFDGSGFTDMKVRGEMPFKLSERQIKNNDIEPMIAKTGFTKISKVFTGYGQSYREELKSTKAYGKNGCAIFYDFKDSFVGHIWLDYHWGNLQTDKDSLCSCLIALGQKWNLVLMDWNQLKLVDLSDSSATRTYLTER